jgi:hypothetical protein
VTRAERTAFLATPRAERDIWFIEDLAAEWGCCTRSIRDAMRFKPHTVPQEMDSPTSTRRWSRTVVDAFIKSGGRHGMRRQPAA